jgi:hypothetical protein
VSSGLNGSAESKPEDNKQKSDDGEQQTEDREKEAGTGLYNNLQLLYILNKMSGTSTQYPIPKVLRRILPTIYLKPIYYKILAFEILI